MRDYKFRGKTKNGEWVYGSLFLINEKSYIYERNYGDLDDIDFGRGFEEVLPETVGQFTGLLDRNGVEIYEGDILEHDCNSEIFIGFVEFKEGCFGVYDKEKHFDSWVFDYDWKVIGNTHDNSDLLK